MTAQGPSREPGSGAPLRRDGHETGVRRLRWAMVVAVLALLAVAGQLTSVQLVQGEDYAARSVAQSSRTVELPATRGRIYDRGGAVLATSVTSATIYADPRAFEPSETVDGQPVPPAADLDEVATELAPVLDRDVDELRAALETDAHFVYLARQLDYEVGERVEQLDIEGVGVIDEPRRTYPSDSLAGQVVGFTGIDGEGLHGLELYFDEMLAGKPGMLALDRGASGLAIASGTREVVPAEAGTDLALTLDREIQYAAERAAADAVAAHDAVGASVAVLEVGTGEVLAMASAPSYNPNDREEGDQEHWGNRAVTDAFEPGSTQKALTIAAALEEDAVDADTKFEVPDAYEVGGSIFGDSSTHGTQTWDVGEIMERSSNIGTIKIAERLGAERLDAYLRDFGYGSPTGIGFPGESAGLLAPVDSWWSTSLPTIAIGQGVAATLLQQVDAYATLANDGVAVQPRLLRGTVGDDGRLAPSEVPDERRVVSKDTADTVASMLAGVVDGDNGTGANAAVDGYSVAGKTGTARKPSADARGYSDEYVATFTGFAPVDDPEIAVAVMVDEPEPIYGGIVAAPVFSEVMEVALTSRRVAPDTEPDSLSSAFDEVERAEAEQAEADRAARREGAGTAADDPSSPPAGTPAGGDGSSAQE